MSGYENNALLEEEEGNFNEVVDGKDDVFSAGEDSFSVNGQLKLVSKVTTTLLDIDLEDVEISNFKKISRSKTIVGLTGSVSELGVATPIHLMALEDEGTYTVLEGLRRVFAAIRNGVTTVKAIVWDFEDKQEGKTKANLISLMLNRSERYSAEELWEQMKILEEVNGATPGLIEYLLQMQAGDAMKLKDVMLADLDYTDIKTDLIDGLTTIEQAYKKLCAERRKENRLMKEDSMVLEGTAVSGVDDVSEQQNLSIDAVKDLLDLTEQSISGETLEDLDRSNEARGDVTQDPKDRKPLDANLKKAVLARDKFTCQCCGTGGEQWLSVLVCHHIIQVSQGGPDTMENLVTLCNNCHVTLHTYAWGKIYVTLETLSEAEKETFKKIFRYGNVIIEADKRMGRTKEQAMKEDKGSARQLYPGEGLTDNKKAFAEASA